MTLQTKIQQYSDSFKTGKRNDGVDYVFLKDDANEDLHDSVMQAHGNKLPDDWTYGMYADLMQKLTEYTINSIDDVDNYRSEIVESMVDIYTHDLLAWLASDIGNIDYITECIEDGSNDSDKDGYKLLGQAQYRAIDVIFSYIYQLLEI